MAGGLHMHLSAFGGVRSHGPAKHLADAESVVNVTLEVPVYDVLRLVLKTTEPQPLSD